jgi:Tfp pilus assembly protein PilN
MTVMHALFLDFQRTHRAVPWAGLTVLATALVVAAAVANHQRIVNKQIAAWEGKVDQIQRMSGELAKASRQLSGVAARAQRTEAQQANLVLRQIGLPWNAVFKAVEESAGPDIGLLSLEPDLQKGVVRIAGEARNFEALLAYVKQLSARELFGNVLLLSHQVQQDQPDKPVRFALLAYWKETAP